MKTKHTAIPCFMGTHALTATIAAGAFALLMCGCGNGDNTGKTLSTSFDSSNPVVEITSGYKSVSVANVKAGDHVYLTWTNPETYTKSNSNYILSAENITLNNSNTTRASRSAYADETVANAEHNDRRCVSMEKQKMVEDLLKSSASRSAARSSVTSIDRTSSYREYTSSDIGNVIKSKIYLDMDSNGNASYGSATLRGIGNGSNGKPICYVWVIDSWKDANGISHEGYYSSTAAANKVTSAQAQSFADKFVQIYYLDTTILGNPPDKMFGNDYGDLVPIKKLSSTGEVVNIVIYDIDNDYNPSADSNGTYGFVWIKDYFLNGEDYRTTYGSNRSNDSKILNASNEGNYFYLDSGYASNSSSMGDALTTMAHEFQHMICINQKNMINNVPVSSFYNEMMSMITEDMVFAGIPEIKYSDATAISYLDYFDSHYIYNGIEENESYGSLYYSTTYAFAAWLVRNFGGAALINNMSKSEYSDYNSILNAVSSVTGKRYSMETLLNLYTQSCVFDRHNSSYSAKSWNKAVEPYGPTSSLYCSQRSYGYPFVALNLYGQNSSSTSKLRGATISNANSYTLPGITMYAYNAYSPAIRPCGIFLNDVGTVSSNGTITVTLNSSVNDSSPHMYLVIVHE